MPTDVAPVAAANKELRFNEDPLADEPVVEESREFSAETELMTGVLLAHDGAKAGQSPDLCPAQLCSYCNSFKTACCDWFACCSAAIPVDCRMLYCVMFATVLPTSAFMMLLDALVRFWT